VAGTERGAGGGDAAQELEPQPQKERRAPELRAAFSARLTGISRRKGHKNASSGSLKKNEALRFCATMAAISSNCSNGKWQMDSQVQVPQLCILDPDVQIPGPRFRNKPPARGAGHTPPVASSWVTWWPVASGQRPKWRWRRQPPAASASASAVWAWRCGRGAVVLRWHAGWYGVTNFASSALDPNAVGSRPPVTWGGGGRRCSGQWAHSVAPRAPIWPFSDHSLENHPPSFPHSSVPLRGFLTPCILRAACFVY
jgi:hypothetical protein